MKKQENREIVSFNQLDLDLPTLTELDASELALIRGSQDIDVANACNTNTVCGSYNIV